MIYIPIFLQYDYTQGRKEITILDADDFGWY